MELAYLKADVERRIDELAAVALTLGTLTDLQAERLERVMTAGAEILNSKAACIDWLLRTSEILRGRSPLDLIIESDERCVALEAALCRIVSAEDAA